MRCLLFSFHVLSDFHVISSWRLIIWHDELLSIQKVFVLHIHFRSCQHIAGRKQCQKEGNAIHGTSLTGTGVRGRQTRHRQGLHQQLQQYRVQVHLYINRWSLHDIVGPQTALLRPVSASLKECTCRLTAGVHKQPSHYQECTSKLIAQGIHKQAHSIRNAQASSQVVVIG